MVLGRLTDTAVAKNWPGHVVLNTPDWTMKLNNALIESAIQQRRTIYLASPLEGNMIQKTGAYVGETTIFAEEVKMLKQAGYIHVGDYLVPPR